MAKIPKAAQPTEAPSEPRAYGYARVSTLGQAQDGHGLDVQREKIAAWCTYQGVPLAGIEADEGISGASTDNRPGLRKALRSALQAAPGSILVVYKLDRLGRNALDVQETLAVLLDAGVRVVALADGIDSSSGMGAALLKLLTSILATFAELEKDSIRTRLLDGRRRAEAQSRVYASEPRYGRRVVGEGQLEVNEEEARVLERVRALRAEGRSYRQIGEVLVGEGHKPRRGAQWSPSVLHHIATGRRAPKKSMASTRIARAKAEILA